MALSDTLGIGGIDTLQKIINDTEFINALVPKLAANAGADGQVYTKAIADTTFVKATDLATKVAAKPVVDAIVASTDFTGAVYTKAGADAAFVNVDGTNATDAGVGAMLDKLTDKVVQTSQLPTKVAETAVVDAIVASTDFTGAVYTKTAADSALALKVDVAGDNATEAGVEAMLGKITTDTVVRTSGLPAAVATEVEKSAVAAKILGAKDGEKLVLVTELGKALDTANTDYDGSKTAKAFLGEKGLTPTAAEVAAVPALLDAVKSSVTITANAADAGFAGAVRAVVSTQVFDTPANDSDPFNFEW